MNSLLISATTTYSVIKLPEVYIRYIMRRCIMRKSGKYRAGLVACISLFLWFSGIRTALLILHVVSDRSMNVLGWLSLRDLKSYSVSINHRVPGAYIGLFIFCYYVTILFELCYRFNLIYLFLASFPEAFGFHYSDRMHLSVLNVRFWACCFWLGLRPEFGNWHLIMQYSEFDVWFS